MSHEHEHAGHRQAGHEHAHHAHEPQKSRGLHKDWRAWAVVGLMILGMVAYVMSLDEADAPGGGGQAMPEAPAVP
jgi:ABC-type nickel/cobalt efflux system permease component RcnA